MKKYFMILFLLIVVAGFTVAQQWHWQNFFPQGNTQNAVFFISEKKGWIVGDLGTMLKTTDGGSSWEVVTLDTEINLNSLYFLSEHTGFAVGDNGLILTTTDGGNNWESSYDESGVHFYSVYFSSTETGWIGGDNCTVLKTTDSGKSWKNANIGLRCAPYSIHFYSESHGWMTGTAGDGNILRTTDGGETWESKHLDNRMYYSIFDVSETTAFAALNFSELMCTTDGGESWEKDTVKHKGQEIHFKSLFFISDSIGWLTGQLASSNYSGVILKTTDAGKEWRVIKDDIRWSLNSLYFIDDKIGWAVGDKGLILETTDGGNTWYENFRVMEIPVETFRSVDCISPTAGWAVGFGGLAVRTTDGGRNWVTQETGTDSHLFAVNFINGSTGWAGGSDGIILKTTDGGKDWIQQYGEEGTFIHSIEFFSENIGVASTPQYVLRTTDGGTNWSKRFVEIEVDGLGPAYFYSEKIGWIPGNLKNIYKTTDGGETWSEITIPVTTELPDCEFRFNSIFFVNENTGWAVGNGGIIMQSNDGGNTWHEQMNVNDIGYDLFSVYFYSELKGCAAGRNGNLFQTTNGGLNWERVYTHTTMDLYDISLISDESGWVVGKWGTILSTAGSNVTGIELQNAPDIPVSFSLSQNYPNPFNPSTVINYRLSAFSNVKLTVYNVLGQKIKTLIDSFQSAGEHSAVWDATTEQNLSVSSGTYFYRLETDNWVLRKKMILIR